MTIKEFENLKREVLTLKEELERVKEEHRSARIEQLRQAARCIHRKSLSPSTYLVKRLAEHNIISLQS